MRVVQINATFGIGSTGQLVRDIHDALKHSGNESYVFWATGSATADDPNIRRVGTTADHKAHALLRRIDGKQAWHSKSATVRLCKQLEQIRPSVVHLHNLHSNYLHLPMLLEYLAKGKVPTVATLHDTWLFTGCCTHPLKWGCDKWKAGCKDCPAVKGVRRRSVEEMYSEKSSLFQSIDRLGMTGVSMWITETGRQSPVFRNAVANECIYNWIDEKVFYPENSADTVNREFGIPQDERIVLGVSQGWSNEKGIVEFSQLALRLRGKARVVLVGHVPDSAVRELRDAVLVGRVVDRYLLRALYSRADVLANPSRMETFGLVSAEAMACGTPVVAYNNTGICEVVSTSCGELVNDGDMLAFVDAVARVLDSGKNQYTHACVTRVGEMFSKAQQTNKYIEFYKRLSCE